MEKEIEKEVRLLISKEIYEKMVSYYLKEKLNLSFINQSNIYYDDSNLTLLKHHIVLRVRLINQTMMLQCKIKQDDGDLELHYPINNIPENIKLSSYKEVLKAIHYLPIKEVNKICQLDTKRLEIPMTDYLIVLDENNYFDVTDYNLEVEANDKKRAREEMIALGKRFNFIYQQDSISKSRRAISYYLNKIEKK